MTSSLRILLALSLAGNVLAQQGTPAPTASGEFIASWKSLGSDGARLQRIVVAPGPEHLLALQQLSLDTSLSRVSRMHAIWAMAPYVAPGFWCVRDSLQLTKYWCGGGSHPNYSASNSIEPSRRREAQILLNAIETREEGAVRLVAQETLHASLPEGRSDFLSDTARHHCEILSRTAPVALALDVSAAVAAPDFAKVVTCTELGPDVLAKAWSLIADSSSALPLLGSLSARLSDQRILDALLKVSSNVSLPIHVRRFALRSAATQLHPRMLSYVAGQNTGGTPCGRWPFYPNDAVPFAGAVPVEGISRFAGLNALRNLQSAAANEVFRTEVRSLATCVEFLLAPATIPR